MPVLTSGQQERKSKQRKIRNSEYYDMEGTFDRLYASSEPTIEKYLKSLNLDNKQIEKLNKLRSMAEMPPIIL